MEKKFIIPFREIRMRDVAKVGGKTASLGELMSIGMPVPDGFAVTADAYRYFIDENFISENIRRIIKKRNLKDVSELGKIGLEIRGMINGASFPKDIEEQIMHAFRKMKISRVAVRSSATAEDLPDASFAGQQESFLNVNKNDLLKKIRQCFASLFTDRAISYREDKHFDHFNIALSVAVQKQVFSDSSGVMFTMDPDSGHRNFIVIDSSYGLGDYIVQGKVVPDEFWVFKKTCRIVEKRLGIKKMMEVRRSGGVSKRAVPKRLRARFSITDSDAENLAGYAKMIESHYKKPMDIEWAREKDRLYILQARPETVHGKKQGYSEYALKERSRVIAEGIAIGRKISSGRARVLRNAKDIHKFRGGVLVTTTTNPDWEPIMKIASGIITEKGGRTSHAAIVSRELGVPAVVGVENATRILKNGTMVTIDCSGQRGKIWSGELEYSAISHDISRMPKTGTKILVNIGIPDEAVDASLLPVDGVGLAREEFIISGIGVHPLEMIRQKRRKEFIEKLYYGIAKIAAAFYPRPVIVRLSDFKSNEYRNLEGGEKYEPREENPMLGWRGASRYVGNYKPAFLLELDAIKKVVANGMNNIRIMVPFCRTTDEAKSVVKLIRSKKIKAGIGVMAEIPSNVMLADKFSEYFQFFSVGSNDLTQLTLGIDRDNSLLDFDERNEAVKRMIRLLINTAHKKLRTVGICGQAPSDYPEFVKFLVECGIDSISVNLDAAMRTKMMVAEMEGQR